MKEMILLLCGCMTLFTAHAQSDKSYSPGYVVKMDGDTVRGSIRYQRWDKNPRKILFRVGDRESEYHPIAIRAFFAGGEHYESALVDVDTSPVQLHELNENREPTFVKDTVFLQCLFRGEKKLLYLKDQKGREHFYIDDNGFKPLVYKKYIRIFESMQGLIRKFMDENKDYHKQLFSYLSNCPEIQKKIEASSYQTGSLTRLFSEYHVCINKPVRYQNTRKSLELQPGVLAGATRSRLRFFGDPSAFYYLTDPAYTQSWTPSVGVFADVKLLSLERIKLVNELLLASFDIRGKGVARTQDEITSRFSYQFLKMQNLFQFDILRNGYLHLQAGLSMAAVLKKEHSIHLLYYTGMESERDFKSRSYEFGAIGGLGTDFGRITADLRYELTTGISQHPQPSASEQGFNLILKYRLIEK